MTTGGRGPAARRRGRSAPSRRRGVGRPRAKRGARGARPARRRSRAVGEAGPLQRGSERGERGERTADSLLRRREAQAARRPKASRPGAPVGRTPRTLASGRQHRQVCSPPPRGCSSRSADRRRASFLWHDAGAWTRARGCRLGRFMSGLSMRKAATPAATAVEARQEPTTATLAVAVGDRRQERRRRPSSRG